MKRHLYAGEHELQSWGSLTLTTNRIIQYLSFHGFDASTSLMLEHVEWTRLSRRHKPWLLIVGGCLVGLGVLALVSSANAGALPLAAGLVFLLFYLATRRLVLVVAAGEGRIALTLKGTDRVRQLALDYLDVIEGAAQRARHQLPASSSAPPLLVGPPPGP